MNPTQASVRSSYIGDDSNEHISHSGNPLSGLYIPSNEDNIELLYQTNANGPTTKSQAIDGMSVLTAELKVEEVSPLALESGPSGSNFPVGSSELATVPSILPIFTPSFPGQIIELLTHFGSGGNRDGTCSPISPGFQHTSLSPQHAFGPISNLDTVGCPFIHAVSCSSAGNPTLQLSQPDYPSPGIATMSSIANQVPFTGNMKRASLWPDPRLKRRRLVL